MTTAHELAPVMAAADPDLGTEARTEAPTPDASTPRQGADSQASAPYADALRGLAAGGWQRLHVPAHQGAADRAPGVASLVGEHALGLDLPMLFSGVDQDSWSLSTVGRSTPLQRAEALAAEAWGSSRTWFLTSGASGGNHIATAVARGLGRSLLVQRSVHSSVIDGLGRVGADPTFVQGSVDPGMGAVGCLTSEQVDEALHTHPDCTSVLIVSPSYFGAVADVADIAAIAHAHGVPLIVDEAWGAHFGLDPELPRNAVQSGADLVVSSTHKGAGSLTQSAMLHLGHGPHAAGLEPLVERMVRSHQSTSCSSLLLASLDETRRLLVTRPELVAEAVASARSLAAALRADRRYRDGRPDIIGAEGSHDQDPLKVVIDTRGAAITGTDAQHLLMRDHHILIEMATPAAMLAMVGATTPVDVDRLMDALLSLPAGDHEPERVPAPPTATERALSLGGAYFAASELVPAEDAIGRISSDALAAYPPGVPNVLPGEILTPEVIDHLQRTAAHPSGHVRGAADPELRTFRVLSTGTEITA